MCNLCQKIAQKVKIEIILSLPSITCSINMVAIMCNAIAQYCAPTCTVLKIILCLRTCIMSTGHGVYILEDKLTYMHIIFFVRFGHQDGISSIDCLSRERPVTGGMSDRTVRLWKVLEESQLVFHGHK